MARTSIQRVEPPTRRGGRLLVTVELHRRTARDAGRTGVTAHIDASPRSPRDWPVTPAFPQPSANPLSSCGVHARSVGRALPHTPRRPVGWPCTASYTNGLEATSAERASRRHRSLPLATQLTRVTLAPAGEREPALQQQARAVTYAQRVTPHVEAARGLVKSELPLLTAHNPGRTGVTARIDPFHSLHD
jgi:hypothetical protein